MPDPKDDAKKQDETKEQNSAEQSPPARKGMLAGVGVAVHAAGAAVNAAKGTVAEMQQVEKEAAEVLREADKALGDFFGLFGYTKSDVVGAMAELKNRELEVLPRDAEKLQKTLQEFKRHFGVNRERIDSSGFYRRFQKIKKDDHTFATAYQELERLLKEIHVETVHEIQQCYTFFWNALVVITKTVAGYFVRDPNPGSAFNPLMTKLQTFCTTAQADSDKLSREISKCKTEEDLDKVDKEIQTLENSLVKLLDGFRPNVLRYIEDKTKQVVDALKRLLNKSEIKIDKEKLTAEEFITHMPNVLILFRIFSSIAGVESKHADPKSQKHGKFGYGFLAKLCQNCIEQSRRSIEERKQLIQKNN